MRALGMDDVEIDSVETDNPRSLKDKIYESLVLWVKENKEKATKAALIRALRDGSVERNDLASKMEKGKYWKKYVSGEIFLWYWHERCCFLVRSA